MRAEAQVQGRGLVRELCEGHGRAAHAALQLVGVAVERLSPVAHDEVRARVRERAPRGRQVKHLAAPRLAAAGRRARGPHRLAGEEAHERFRRRDGLRLRVRVVRPLARRAPVGDQDRLGERVGGRQLLLRRRRRRRRRRVHGRNELRNKEPPEHVADREFAVEPRPNRARARAASALPRERERYLARRRGDAKRGNDGDLELGDGRVGANPDLREVRVLG